MRVSLVSIFAVVAMMSSSGFAEESVGSTCAMPLDSQGQPACLCVIPTRALQKAPVALLSYVHGGVLKSGENGFTPVSGPSTPLKVGDTVLLPADAEAVLTAGACSHAIGPQASLVITRINGSCACASVSKESPPPAPQQSASADGSALMTLGAATAVGVGVLLLASPGPVSP